MSMTRLAALVRKEFIQIARDPRTLYIIIAIPVVQLFLLGYTATTDVRNVPLAVLDQDPRPAPRRPALARRGPTDRPGPLQPALLRSHRAARAWQRGSTGPRCARPGLAQPRSGQR